MLPSHRVEAASPIVQPPSAIRPEKVKCKVTRSPGGAYSITLSPTGIAMPHPRNIRAFLSKKAQDFTRNHYWAGNILGIMQAVGTTIRTKEWAAAIAKAVVFSLTHEADSEVELLAVQGGGYLSLGNCLFRIDAVDHITTGKALPALRRTVLEDARAQSVEIVRQAESHASTLLNEANAERTRIVAQSNDIERLHQRLSADILCVPPSWTEGQLLMRKYDKLCIFFWVNVKIEWFEWNDGCGMAKIDAKEAPALQLLMGCPIDRDYHESAITLYSSEHMGWLPHITDYSCGHFANAPATLKSVTDLEQLARAIASATRGVNLSSLLTYPNRWIPKLFDFVPKKLEKAIENIRLSGSVDYSILSKLAPDTVERGDTFYVKI